MNTPLVDDLTLARKAEWKASWTLLWIFHAFVVLLIKTTVWTTAVSSIFDASRSLAIAITISGTAVVMAIVPPLARG